ncbi:hypothetical protein DID96_17740 [Burkholderia sp. Bp8963]|uniref:hypothetical protein n=1 Tax=Burkholderia sp. Bp8963 TaxID=2184547 RepID=UPI000F59099F|nr:hypothetical protein [Burkholderia sp. Bp8963]RQS69214.1 hypothetical protein DID96_17740 [Burkholderia sp. Bp8963]
MAGSGGGTIVETVNRAAYSAEKEAGAENAVRPDNGVVPKMSATQGALNNLNYGRIQIDAPDWKASSNSGSAAAASGASAGASR